MAFRLIVPCKVVFSYIFTKMTDSHLILDYFNKYTSELLCLYEKLKSHTYCKGKYMSKKVFVLQLTKVSKFP